MGIETDKLKQIRKVKSELSKLNRQIREIGNKLDKLIDLQDSG